MSFNVRYRKLLEHVEALSVVTVPQLVELLDCSPATVRRDISELDQQGKLKKIRNGAEKILSPKGPELEASNGFYPHISDYDDYEESCRIARQAVNICSDKDSIFIGAGANAFLLGEHLLNTNIHVYSNNVPLFSYLISQTFPHLVVLGGQYIKNQNLLVSPELKLNFQGRYLFVEADGLTEAGLTKSAMLAYMEEKRMRDYLDKVVVLINSDKVGEFSGVPLFTLDEIDIVITGKDADPKMIDTLRQQHIDVYLT